MRQNGRLPWGPVGSWQHWLLLGWLSVLASPGHEDSSHDTGREHFPSKKSPVLQPHLPAARPSSPHLVPNSVRLESFYSSCKTPGEVSPLPKCLTGLRTKQEHARVNTWAWLRGEGIVLTAVLVVR